MKINDDYLILGVITIIFAMTAVFLVYGGGQDILGLSAADTNNLIMILPAVAAIVVAFYAVVAVRGVMLSAAISGFGLAFAYLIYALNEVEILIPDIGIPCGDLQVVSIIIFLIIGAGVAVVNR